MKIGYARVSDDEQNLSLQLNALNNFGCDKIFIDDGISAVAGHRPEFEKAVAALTPGDTLVIWKMDRAFRDLLSALKFLNEYLDQGIFLSITTEWSDVKTPHGRYVYQVSNANSEYERAKLIERTIAGMAAAKRRGIHCGRPRKLNEEQVAHARRALATGKRCIRTLGKQYGVAPITVKRAVQRVNAKT